jgi:hypothetical protein
MVFWRPASGGLFEDLFLHIYSSPVAPFSFYLHLCFHAFALLGRFTRKTITGARDVFHATTAANTPHPSINRRFRLFLHLIYGTYLRLAGFWLPPSPPPTSPVLHVFTKSVRVNYSRNLHLSRVLRTMRSLGFGPLMVVIVALFRIEFAKEGLEIEMA